MMDVDTRKKSPGGEWCLDVTRLQQQLIRVDVNNFD